MAKILDRDISKMLLDLGSSEPQFLQSDPTSPTDECSIYQDYTQNHCDAILSKFEDSRDLMIYTDSIKFLCLTISLLTVMFLYSDKRLTTHPGGLIALIFTFLGGFLQLKDQQQIICKFKTYKLLSFSLKLVIHKLTEMNNCEAEYYIFATQIVFHYLMYEFFMMMYLMLCVCISWDLYQTIKNPLYPANKRLRWYIITSVVLILALFAVEYKLISGSIIKALDPNDESQNFEGYMNENRQKWKVLLIAPLLGQLFIGFFSCYKAYGSFKSPGVGQEVRIRVIKRQMSFVFITVICNTPLTIVEVTKFAMVHIFKYSDHESKFVKDLDYIHDWIFLSIQYSASIWLSLLILSDPFTYLILKKQLVCVSKK